MALLIESRFAGGIKAMDYFGDADLQPGNCKYIAKQVSIFKTDLQACQARATASGQSFEHMVLLEAAVQGWCMIVLLLSFPVPALLKHGCTCGSTGIAYAHITPPGALLFILLNTLAISTSKQLHAASMYVQVDLCSWVCVSMGMLLDSFFQRDICEGNYKASV